MDPGKAVGQCAFEMLFTRNVPHILEKIFFSLDYESFQTCFKVNSTWNELLSSESYQKITTKMLIEKEKNEKKHWDISDLGKTSKVKQLVSAGGWMNINCVAGQDQSTPLYQAAWHGHTDVVQVLLDEGAETDKANNFGSTPLLKASYGNHKEVVQLLLRGNADLKKMNKSGHSPLQFAALYGNKDVAQVLLDAGADPDQADTAGWTPLYSDRKEIVQLLLERGADPNKANIDGYTLLHWAALSGRHDVVQLLLAGGADPNKTNRRGQTPLQYATEKGRDEIVQLLQAHFANQ